MIIKKFIINMLALIFTFSILLTGCKTNNKINLLGSTNNDVQSKLLRYMDNYYKKNEFSGTVLVTQDDEVILNKGYGKADYNKNIINKPQTVFEIASLTKQFTATAILMLQENKLISVQDTVSKYIPDYPNGDSITLYNLLTHTSGIPDYLDSIEPIESKDHTYTPEELVEFFKNEPSNFTPGTSFEYSNSNYTLLGYIIEKVSNMSYEDYIENNILKPLNMSNTGFINNKVNVKDSSIGYYFINKKLIKQAEAPETEALLSYSAGEIYSTSEDLNKWEDALFNEKVITKDSLDEMLTPYLNNYGYGWFINENNDGDKIVFHSGNLPGYTSYVERNIDKNYKFIILCNENIDDAIDSISMGLSEILDNNLDK